MKKIDNRIFYEQSHKEYGISAQGVRWSSKKNQYIRFKYLLDFIKDDLTNSSILDLGCGYGHLINYFQDNNIYPKSYIGIDCEDFMINHAKKRFPDSNFLRKNFLKDSLPNADYYLCSGAFNTLKRIEIAKAIKLHFEQSNKGLVFNILTNAFIHELNAFDVYNYCQSLTKKLEFKSDYLKNDYTFFLKK